MNSLKDVVNWSADRAKMMADIAYYSQAIERREMDGRAWATAEMLRDFMLRNSRINVIMRERRKRKGVVICRKKN